MPLLFLIAAGCGEPPTATSEVKVPIVTKPVEIRTVAEVASSVQYQATGAVRARFNAILSSKVMSRVTSVLAREGDAVRKGQTLVVLDSRELAAGVRVAQANLNATRVGVDNAITAREMELKTSSARIAQVEAEVARSRAALNAALSQLDLVLAGPRVQEKNQARLAVIQAESTLRLAKTQLDRVSRLVEAGALARRDLDQAQNGYEVALAQRDSAIQADKIAQEGSRAEEIRAAREGVAQAQAGLKQAEANLRFAKASALQAKVRSQEVRSATAQVSQASAALQSASVSLGYGTVAAPFDGRIVERSVDPGAMAMPGTPLIALEGGDLRLEAVVPETVLAHVRLHQSIRLRIDALDRDVTGVVDEIVPQGDLASHTFMVRIKLPATDGVKSGMFGRAYIATGTRRSIEVPHEATWQREGLNYVFVVNPEGLARLRIVTLGDRNERTVSILSGLNPGERLIVGGREHVADGMKVRAR